MTFLFAVRVNMDRPAQFMGRPWRIRRMIDRSPCFSIERKKFREANAIRGQFSHFIARRAFLSRIAAFYFLTNGRFDDG